MTENKWTIEQLMEGLIIEAKERKEVAGYQGRHGDGGSSVLLNQLKWYKMGMEKQYPKEWEAYTKHIDDEYLEYLRLKKKFK